MPPLGDELVSKLGVPIGFVACGIGASSVREWLPEGSTFPNPPPSRIEYANLQMARGKAMVPHSICLFAE